MKRSAYIVAQGDEILAGSTQDSNSSALARQLSRRGVAVQRICAAGDDEAELAELLARAADQAWLVICSGGLGPTDDDCTAAAAARAFGKPLGLVPEALAQIEARFAAVGWKMPPSNRKQAMLPRGATLLENPVGTAPGFLLEQGPTRLFFFPGVPRELERMSADHLWPWLETQGHPPLRRRLLHVCGVGESALQDRLDDLELPAGVRLGYKTWLPYNSVVLYAAADRDAELEHSVAAVRARLGPDCFGADDETLPAVLGALLQRRGWTLATAESCTAGGAGALITQAAGSSAWFAGGVIAYSNRVKQRLLDVSEAVLVEHGAVSEPCAEAMAAGARARLGSDVAVSITGIAGPDGGTADKPVGTVCFGLATPDGVRGRTVKFGARGREQVRALSAAAALEWLRRSLVKSETAG